MGEYARKSDGRRVFSPEFKRDTVQRLNSGEITLAELSRDLDIAPQVIRNWKRRFEEGATTAVGANDDVVPASELRTAQQRIRELERPMAIDGCGRWSINSVAPGTIASASGG